MRCPTCDAENTQDSQFCKKCATPLTEVAESRHSITKTIEIPREGLAPGATFAGRYQIIEILGKGGMGTVYRVKDQKLDEEMALKLLKPEIAAKDRITDRFKNELKLARKISHPHVCRMYDFHEQEITPFITMEYCTGIDLKGYIRKSVIIPEDKAIHLAKQICTGMEAAHLLGVIHRDLKPQNIMIDEADSVKIMDFGIAHSLDTKGFTQTGMIIGTPDYISPEQAEGRPVDARTDIYSLGVILYELVTGQLPFEGDSALSIALKHRSEVPLAPQAANEKISEALNALILKCLRKDPDKRYQSVLELFEDLERLEAGNQITAAIETGMVPAFLKLGEEAAAAEARPVFVAREQDLKRLENFQEKALQGKGQVVFVTAEAGGGKTALLQEFCYRAQAASPDLIVASGKCNAHTGIGDPYLPFIELLGLLTGDVEAKWEAGVVSTEHAVRLWKLTPYSAQAVFETGQDLLDTFLSGKALLERTQASCSVVFDWMAGLRKAVERKAALPPDAMLQQSNLFEQYTRVLQTLSRQKPLLLVLDDLQWIDAGSASLLFHLGRRISGNRILILGAFRPDEIVSSGDEERHPLDAVIHELKRDFGNIEVEVGKTEGRTFVEALIDSEPNLLGNEFRNILYQQTKGHALFTIELLRNMQESGFILRDEEGRWIEGADPNWDELPARVDAVFEERIRRLAEESRDILTTASVEGEEFTAEVISQMLDTGVRDLVRLLSKDLDKRHHLVSAKGMRKLGLRSLSLYLFQHILFQRYLYNSLDSIERVHLHGEVGHILENLYGNQADEIAVQLARHFHEAGEIEKAILYYHKAGDKAVSVSANLEAIKHFRQALELLFTLSESLDRDKQELTLQLALTIPIMATMGFAAPELGRAAKRARELCQRFGDTPEVFIALMQMSLYYSTLPEYRTALELADEAITLADKLGDPMLQAISLYYYCWAKLNLGELNESYESTKKMNALYDPEKHGYLAYVFGYDMGVVSLCFGGWALWLLGYPDRAKEQINTAIAHARIIEHPNTMAFALVGGIFMNLLLCSRELIEKYTDELALLSHKNGLLFWIGHAQIYAGERKILEGQVKEGIAEMRKGVATIQATGSETCLSRLLTRMAEACRVVGEVEEGLKAVEDALEFRRRFDEVYMEPELFRLKGELFLMKGADDKDAEECFHKAIEAAKGQESKSLELRAVMSLSRLFQKQNKIREAKALLEEIYGWFTEGFDTPDLLQARAMLAELS